MKNTSAWTMILVLFLPLTISCQSIPSTGMNIAYPSRPETPQLEFKNAGAHCINDSELRQLGSFYIDAMSYFDETEAIIDAVNGK